MEADQITRQDVESALTKVLDSEEFQSAPLRRQFLEYVVTEALEGRSKRLKGTSIAIDLYGRDTDFDQQTDPIVRVEARKMRRDLEHYYLTSGASDDIIIDIPKGGYTPRFTRRTIPAQDRGSVDNAPDPATERPGPELRTSTYPSETGTPSHRLIGRPMALIVATLALLCVAVVALMWPDDPTASVDTSSAGPRLFVLPFEPTSQDPAELALAKGITLEIVDRLSGFKGFEVYPVSAAYPLENIIADSGEKVAFTLDGFVQVAASDVRVTSILRRARDGQHIWSGRYIDTYAPDRVFDIQDLIARNVIGELAESHGLLGEISLREISHSTTPTLQSYECVLLGYQYRAILSRDLHGKARDCLERVVQSDPDYARAWALLAHVYTDEYRFFYNTRPDARQRSVEAGRKAVELDPNDALSYQAASIGLYVDGQIEPALAAARTAIELNPQNYVALLQLGYRTLATGRWEEAAQQINEAYDKTVSPPGWYPWVIALLRIREGDYEAARVLAESTTIPQLTLFEATRAAIYGQLGESELAELYLERARQLDPDFDSRASEWFARHNFRDELLDPIMEGLAKAGLQTN